MSVSHLEAINSTVENSRGIQSEDSISSVPLAFTDTCPMKDS